MIGLDFRQLCMAFETSLDRSVELLREDQKRVEEITGVHYDEFPMANKALENIAKQFEEWDLSTEEVVVVFYLNLLRVIELNNMAIEKSLKKAGVRV